MMTILTILELGGAAILGAALFWLRGSSKFEEWTGRGKTTGDAVWAAGMGLLVFSMGASWYGAIALAIGMFLGGRLPWWRSLSLGRNAADGPEGLQYLRHAARGMMWVAPAALMASLGGMSPYPLLVAGLFCVPAYVIGYAWREGDGSPYSNPTAVGEMLFGAAIAVGAAVSTWGTWGVLTWSL